MKSIIITTLFSICLAFAYFKAGQASVIYKTELCVTYTGDGIMQDVDFKIVYQSGDKVCYPIVNSTIYRPYIKK